MISRLHLSPIVFLVGILWLGALVLDGVAVEPRWIFPFSIVLSTLLVLLGAFDRWFWRWKLLNGWFANRPVLSGTWEVTLESEWVDQKTGERPEPVACFMAVRQTFSTLSMRLMTPESSSWLLTGDIRATKDEVYQVAGVYMNKPDLRLRGERSEIHYGALLLDVHGQPPEELRGHYWTDRWTRGTLKLAHRKPKVYENYEQARAALGPSPLIESHSQAAE